MEMLTPGQLKKRLRAKKLDAIEESTVDEIHPPKASKVMSSKVLDRLNAICDSSDTFDALENASSYDDFMATLFPGYCYGVS